MARTTSDKVKELVETDDAVSVDLVVFIETANALVTEHCAVATDEEGALLMDEVRLELVERWLAAHFYAIRDNFARTTNEKAGSVAAGYYSKVDLGLNVTHWGQQAMMLDTSGALAGISALTAKAANGQTPAAIGRRKRVGVKWGGSKCP